MFVIAPGESNVMQLRLWSKQFQACVNAEDIVNSIHFCNIYYLLFNSGLATYHIKVVFMENYSSG